MSGIKAHVIGVSDTRSGSTLTRPDSAPPATTTVARETPVELRGLGSKGDLDEEFDDDDAWVNGRLKSESALARGNSNTTTSHTRMNSGGFGSTGGNARGNGAAGSGLKGGGSTGGMKLGGVKEKKKSVADQVVEEEEFRQSIDDGADAWGALDDWNDEDNADEEDGWGFDD